MNKWIVIAEGDCLDKSQEESFNQWFNMVHIPDILEIPEVKKASRFKRVHPKTGEARYLAMYEIHGDDLDQIIIKVEQNLEKKRREGRISPLLNMTSMHSYSEIFTSE